MRDDLLFYGRGEMFGVTEARKEQVKEYVERIPKTKILSASEDDLVAALVEDLRLHVPTISDEHLLETRETKVDVSRDPMRLISDRSRPFYIPGTMVVITIPFDGDAAFFHIQPSTFSLNPPRGKVVGNELQLSYSQTETNAEAINREYKADVDQIKSHLRSLASSAEQFHQVLPTLVRSQLQARKNRLLAADGLVSALGLKLKRRPDAPVVAVPLRKRTPRIDQIQVPNKEFQPEPSLASEDYDEILRIMSNMVHVMERSPNAFVGMDEESLRTHFLVQLNGQYEGQATGETFNFEGKTDILIRSEGRNVFIAECKFWKGPRELCRAIDQLLSYLSWRDTKAAVVVFNRNVGFSETLAAIQQTTSMHAHCKRIIGSTGETSFRYVFGQPTDANREILLTVMVFDVPTKERMVKTAPPN